MAGAGCKSAAMEPHHDRAVLAVIDRRRPDVDVQAVFILHAVVPGKHERFFVVGPAGARALRRHVAVLTRTAHAVPRCCFERRHEAIRALPCCRVRHALEGKDSVSNVTGHLARAGFDNGHAVLGNHRWLAASGRRLRIRRGACRHERCAAAEKGSSTAKHAATPHGRLITRCESLATLVAFHRFPLLHRTSPAPRLTWFFSKTTAWFQVFLSLPWPPPQRPVP